MPPRSPSYHPQTPPSNAFTRHPTPPSPVITEPPFDPNDMTPEFPSEHRPPPNGDPLLFGSPLSITPGVRTNDRTPTLLRSPAPADLARLEQHINDRTRRAEEFVEELRQRFGPPLYELPPPHLPGSRQNPIVIPPTPLPRPPRVIVSGAPLPAPDAPIWEVASFYNREQLDHYRKKVRDCDCESCCLVRHHLKQMKQYLWGRRERRKLYSNSFARQPDLDRRPHSIPINDLIHTFRDRRILRPRPLKPHQFAFFTRPAAHRYREILREDEEIWWEARDCESWDYCSYLDDRSRRAILERG